MAQRQKDVKERLILRDYDMSPLLYATTGA